MLIGATFPKGNVELAVSRQFAFASTDNVTSLTATALYKEADAIINNKGAFFIALNMFFFLR